MIVLLINHLWQTTLFCGAIWLLTVCLRQNRAATRHWLWLLASVKFLLPFSMLYLLGGLLGLPGSPEAMTTPVSATLQGAEPLISPVLTLQAMGGELTSALPAALFVTWFIGALICALRWLFAWRASLAIANAARPAPGSLPDTQVTEALVAPSVTGVLTPVVLLPAALLRSLTAPQLQAVLAHEREHIARRDNLSAHLHCLTEVLFWFHPLVWWIGQRLLQERELACDEAVVESGHEPMAYASGIIEAARVCCAHSGHAAEVSALSGDLPQRIQRILVSSRSASLGALKVATLTVSAVLAVSVPLVAGAMGDARHRHELLSRNSLTLNSAQFFLRPVSTNLDDSQQLLAASHEVLIRNSSLRGLVALAYGVENWQVRGADSWLDSQRYELRVVTPQLVSEPADLDPRALRGVVTKLVATRFDLEIHLNHHCQAPCGRNALAHAALAR